jgi:hypothetical protein
VLRSKFRRSENPCNFKKLRLLTDHHKHPRLILHSLAPHAVPHLCVLYFAMTKKYSRAFLLCRRAQQSAFIRSVVVKTDKSLAFIAHQIVALTPRWPSTSRTGYRTTARTRPSGDCGQDQRHNHECCDPATHFRPRLEFFQFVTSYIAAGRKYSAILLSIVGPRPGRISSR